MAVAKSPSAIEAEGEAVPPRGRRRLVLAGVPLLLAAAGGGLWVSGILPRLLGRRAQSSGKTVPMPPVYVAMPEIIANLDTGGRTESFVKLKVKLELAGAADVKPLEAAMPRVMDLFQTYLRDMHPEELRGSEGTYRLREQLMARANIAAAPAHIVDVLFTELLVQ
ncbi:MAG TPA: flagellar basal body-associated FliL family protein [Acetobacteraceae bacterium]|nr:flagellar basal body-associated FliL family protein [Acetobacteraceae bacterium]